VFALCPCARIKEIGGLNTSVSQQGNPKVLIQEDLEMNREEIVERAVKALSDVSCSILTDDCANCSKVKTCAGAKEGFFQVSNALAYQLLPILSGNALKLYIYVNARVGGDPKNGNYGKCWPGNEQISIDTGINQNHIWQYITELESLNLIRVFYKNETGKRKQRFIYVTWHTKKKKVEDLRRS